MKNVLFILTSLLLFISCNKNHTVDPIDQLPPLTTEGRNKMGCLINGQPFIPKRKGLSSGPFQQCFYQTICKNGQCVNHFSLLGSNTKQGVIQIYFTGTIKEGETYTIDNNNYSTGILPVKTGHFVIDVDNPYSTNSEHTGQITFKRFDIENQVASGTFEFKAVNKNGKIVNVTDGRFDMRFIL